MVLFSSTTCMAFLFCSITLAKSITRPSQLFSRSYSNLLQQMNQRYYKDLIWIDLNIPPHQMLPENTLNMGQCFNWKRISFSDEESTASKHWVGVLHGEPLLVRQLSITTEVASLLPPSYPVNYNASPCSISAASDPDALRTMMRTYFQVEDDLPELYQVWSERCDRMQIVAQCLKGVRVVRQDPWECLISFICSSNNNIGRISLMLDRLRSNYGNFICNVNVPPAGSTADMIIDFQPPTTSDTGILASPSLIPFVKEEILDGEDLFDSYQEVDNKRIMDDVVEGRNSTMKSEAVAADAVIDNDNGGTHYALYTFPTVASIAGREELELRALGVGYRAKFLINSAKLVQEKSLDGQDWLMSLRQPVLRQGCGSSSYSEEGESIKINTNDNIKHDPNEASHRKYVQEQLLQLPGVGMKVADCVALFSLDQTEVIPVDTHVWSIAIRDYAPHLKSAKSLTPTIYEEVGNVFRQLFQKKSGWAHSVLFAAELPNFRQFLPLSLQEEMKQFALEQKQEKALKKQEALASKNATPNSVASKKSSITLTSPSSVSIKKERKGAVVAAVVKQEKNEDSSDANMITTPSGITKTLSSKKASSVDDSESVVVKMKEEKKKSPRKRTIKAVYDTDDT